MTHEAGSKISVATALSNQPEITKLHTRHIASTSVFLIVQLYFEPFASNTNLRYLTKGVHFSVSESSRCRIEREM